MWVSLSLRRSEGTNMGREGHTGPSWEDCWIALEELEGRVGGAAQVTLWRPVRTAATGWESARVAVTISLPRKGPDKSRKRFGYLGGSKGARTMPAALLRAIQELCWSLDDDDAAAAALAPSR